MPAYNPLNNRIFSQIQGIILSTRGIWRKASDASDIQWRPLPGEGKRPVVAHLGTRSPHTQDQTRHLPLSHRQEPSFMREKIK